MRNNLRGCSATGLPGALDLPGCAITRGVCGRSVRGSGGVGSLPIVKDLEKMARLRRLWLPWFQRWTANPDDPALWPHGWALEELRVSLFAPDVPCVGKVSEKRIEEMWDRL